MPELTRITILFDKPKNQTGGGQIGRDKNETKLVVISKWENMGWLVNDEHHQIDIKYPGDHPQEIFSSCMLIYQGSEF